MNAQLILAGILDSVKLAGMSGMLPPQVAGIALGVVDLYKSLRDQFGAPADSLTNEQLAEALQTRGFELRVANDHWLASHGYGPTS